MGKHRNDGACEKCAEFMNEWGVHDSIRRWFTHTQKKITDMHISCAGRGKKDQEFALANKVTRAEFGESPHNFTPALAVDLFRLVVEEGKPDKASFNSEWYKSIVVPTLPDTIAWGGNFKSFIDSPHFEIKGWQKIPNKILIWEKEFKNGSA